MTDRSHRWIDVSVPLRQGLPVWPDSVGINVRRVMELEAGDDCTVTKLDMDVHIGTHVDAPAHFIKGAIAVDAMSLEKLIGPAWVVDFSEVDTITAADLERADLPREAKRLLFRTRNSRYWSTAGSEFQRDYVGLSADAARWIVDRGVCLAGIDYLSIAPFNAILDTHLTLLGSEVVVVEGLDLSEVSAGRYDMICLPLRLEGADGSPARVVIRKVAS